MGWLDKIRYDNHQNTLGNIMCIECLVTKNELL